ncbi:MAG TPA: glycosyltransferase family 39 protein [Polyangiaceae bacterium]|nr:glycosyltransferase family 39 protein [Polyangiaceae bacterium]
MTTALQVILLLFVPLVTGVLIVQKALGRVSPTGTLPLGLGLGLGLCGLLAFVSLVVVDTVVLAWELALFALVVFWSAKGSPSKTYPRIAERPTPAGRSLLLAASLLVAICVGIFIVQARQSPHGGWDAWDFWNMRARFFHRGGEAWANTFSQIPWWSHPEYPVLQPAMVARGFRVLSSETVLVPMLLGFVFTFAAVSVLYFGVSTLRGRSQGLLAAIVLCCSPYFLYHGTEQYADNPLAFFFLASVVCAALYDHREGRCSSALLLSGLFAGLATFLKNEGLMFFVCFACARSVWVWRKRGRAEWKHQAWTFMAGALLPLTATAFFKFNYAVMPDNAEFYTRQWKEWDRGFVEHVLANASDAKRYRGFFRAWGHHLVSFDAWVVPLAYLLPAYGVIMGRDPNRPRGMIATMLGTFALQALGVSLLFLLWSTYDIFEHMDALGRLLLQMLPTVLFVLFAAVKTPFEVELLPDEDAAAPLG